MRLSLSIPSIVSASRGVVALVRRNLLTFTEDFSNAVWVPANLLSKTVDRIVPTTSLAQHRVDYSVSSSDTTNTFQVELMPDGYGFASLRINTSGACFDLNTGATSNLSAGVTASSEVSTDGYRKCIVTYTGAAATVVRINIESAAGVGTTFSGDGTSGIRLRKAQLEAGSTATAYQAVLGNTFP